MIGAAVRIALIDSGVDPSHPGVRGRGRVAAAVRIDGDGTVRDEAVARDELGHGTAVACALLDLAPGAELLVVRVFARQPRCAPRALAAALAYAAAQGVAFANASLGLGALDGGDLVAGAVRELLASGARLVAPATAHGLPCLPGSLPGVDAVVADANVPRRAPVLRRQGERAFWFASPLPPPGVPGLPPAHVFGDSLAVANVTGFLAAAVVR
jgi:subtilisin family serine protease